MILPPSSKLLFIGDSITDAGRDSSGEETPWSAPGLGHGYVALVNAGLRAAYPHCPVRVINKGVSGHTVRDLAERWHADVLDLEPDWLVVMIGINDVWRQFDTPLQTQKHVLIEDYERILDELLRRTRPTVKGLVLATPYFIESNRADPMRRMMDAYGAVVKKLAAVHDARFVDTQAAFDAVLAHTHPMSLAWDRIHPSAVGHTILSRAFLKTFDAL